MEIKQLENTVNSRVFGLLAGSPGVGKTTQGTTFPKEETLIVSVEDGLLSIAGSGYAFVEVENYKELLGLIQDPPKWVKYLYIDSLTEIYDMLQKELSGKFTSKQNFAKHEELKLMMAYLIRQSRKLDISVFYTCHIKQEKNGLILEDELAFDGKMPGEVKKHFDLVFLLQTRTDNNGQEVREIVTSPSISKVAKRRVSPWLDAKINDIEEANLYALTQKLLGGKQ